MLPSSVAKGGERSCDRQLATGGTLAAGDVDVSQLVRHRFVLEQLNDAFALANEPDRGAIKVSITFD